MFDQRKQSEENKIGAIFYDYDRKPIKPSTVANF